MELVNNQRQVICCCTSLSTQLLFHARQLSSNDSRSQYYDGAPSHHLSDNLKKERRCEWDKNSDAATINSHTSRNDGKTLPLKLMARI